MKKLFAWLGVLALFLNMVPGRLQSVQAIAPSSYTYTLEALKFGDDPSIPSSWTPGNVCAGDGGCYTEGDNVPSRITVSGLSSSNSYSLAIQHDYKDSSNHTGYDNFNRISPVSPDSNAITVGLAYLPPDVVQGGETMKNYTLSFTASGSTAIIYWNSHLGPDAADWNGAELHFRLSSGIGGERGGERVVPIQVNKLLILPSITLTKTIDSGSANPDLWDFNVSPSINGTSTYNIPDGQSSITINNVPSGTYTITEAAGASGYQFNSGNDTSSCTFNGATATATVLEGDPATNATCNFHNTQSIGTVTVTKLIDADGNPNTTGDRTSASGWTFNVGGQAGQVTDINGQTPAVTLTPAAGYDIAETQQAGYSLLAASCTGATSAGWTNLGDNTINDITVGANDIVSCTFINTPNTATINIVKVGNGVSNQQFGFNTTGGLSPSEASSPDFILDDNGNNVDSFSNTKTFTGVAAGTYGVSEVATAGWTLASATCSDQSSVSAISLQAGETITCTFTNTLNTGSIKVNKLLDNDGNGSFETTNPAAFTWTYGATGPYVMGTTQSSFTSGPHTLTENSPAGYHLVGWYNHNGNGSCAAPDGTTLSTVTILTNQTVEITICNALDTATLTLVKTVINDNGGNLLISQVPLFISGTPAISGTSYNVLANTQYTASETQQTGYLASIWGGDCAANGTITLLPGENKTCTITNNDIAPILTFTKIVNNLYGGILGASDFPLFINGGLVTTGVPNTLFANFLYTLTETQQTGYTGGYFTGDCNAIGSISLAVGDNKTCTITNTDVQPKLTVTKVVINDNGGTKEITDFPLFVDLLSVKSGVEHGYNAGTYTVSETNQTGYTSTITGDCAPNGSVTLAVGDVKSCTITNDDIQPTLTINKVCLPSSNGLERFNLQIDNSNVTTDSQCGGSTNGPVGVTIGTHTVGETAGSGTDLANYTPVITGDCASNGSVTLAAGENKSCTITNTRNTGSVQVHKQVDTDGNGTFEVTNAGAIALGFNWNLDTIGTNAFGTTVSNVNTGIHDINENDVPDYHFVGWYLTLDNNKSCSNNPNTSRPAPITVSTGQTTQITLCNAIDTGTVMVHKQVDNDGDGEYVSADNGIFEWILDDDGSPKTMGNAESSVTVGQHTVSENDVPDYHFVGWFPTGVYNNDIPYSCTNLPDSTANHNLPISVNVEANGTSDVTICNARDTGTIIVNKVIDIDGDLDTTTDQSIGENWQFDVDGTGTDTTDSPADSTDSEGSVTFSSLKTGEYNVVETAQPGYDLVSANCGIENGNQDGNTVYSVDVNKDATTQCTFYNTPNGTIHGQKWNDLNGNGVRNVQEDALSGWMINLYKSNDEDGYDFIQSMETSDGSEHFGWYWFEHLFPGDYKVCEVPKDGWNQTYPEDCHTMSLPDGNSSGFEQTFNATFGPEYNFGNHFTPPSLTIEKSNNRELIASEIGDVVTYTIEVTAEGNIVDDVEVNDTLPKDFNYITGSFQVTSSDDGNITSLITEPSYTGNIATWQLDKMLEDEIITINYDAIIGVNSPAGVHKDNAWASGMTLLGEKIFADAGVIGFLDLAFVGTTVNVSFLPRVTNLFQILSHDQTVVLASATKLPQTGSPIWLFATLAALLTGIMILISRFRNKLAYLTFGIVLFVAASVLPAHALAADNSLNLRVNSIQTPTNISTPQIGYTILDLEQRNDILVDCLKMGPSDISFNSFQTTTLPPRTGSCNLPTLTASGTYQVKVIASVGLDSTNKTVSFDYIAPGPGTPVNYSKTVSGCNSAVSFATASDGGKTVGVEVYRSDTKTITTSSSNLVEDISVGSATSVNKTYSSPDCGKTFFYAVRAYDAAHNYSAMVGDEEINQVFVEGPAPTGTTITPSGTTSGRTAGTSAGSTTPAATPSISVTEGQPEAAVSPTGEDNGQVQGAETNDSGDVLGTQAETNRTNMYLYIGLGLIVLAAAYLVSRKYLFSREK